ncbi:MULTISPECIES: GNAT family N-acetyltransferase [Streptomyces]|uniref:Acetyltransferase n=2 Tax=Streptomyces TaxID=1883 RepID=A0A117IW11_9ACTN|nr:MULTISPECIES: GNAT family protein [Streptomyces]KUH38663.1 acetyltransferase [Streptomyces kanasensis]UUS31149.1 GNAT family N-acetyltransferase [Streptomyces changanensis]
MTDFSHKPTLTGDRVVLRPLTAADTETMAGVIDDPETARLTGSAGHPPFTIERLRAWYASRAEQTDRLDLGLVDRASGELVGELVLHEWDEPNRSCGFRIAIGPHGRDRGLGTEAVRLLLGYGFERLGLHRIHLEVYAFNPRALRVYERVGFVREGVGREALLHGGEWIDAVRMAILAPEWARHHGHVDDGGRGAHGEGGGGGAGIHTP